MLNKIFILLLICYFVSLQVFGKDNFKFSFLGGPGYTSDEGFFIGASVLTTFSTDTEDSDLRRSVIPLVFGYLFTGGADARIRPQLFFNKDNFRIFGEIFVFNAIKHYYGVGEEKTSSTERGETTTKYRNISYKLNPIFLFRFRSTNIFIGTTLDLSYEELTDLSEGVRNDPDYIEMSGDSDEFSFYNTGLGINIIYDTRDIPANAYKGLLLEFKVTKYNRLIGSTFDFTVYEALYKQFKELKFLGKRKILAWMLNSRFSTGDVPITQLSTLGSPFDFRGYHVGHHRDRNIIYTLLEYRHMFNAGDSTKFRKLLSRFGYVIWGGLASMSHEIGKWSNALPNYGIGLRFETQPRMNFRLDLGVDPTTNDFLLYFNMTEAF